MKWLKLHIDTVLNDPMLGMLPLDTQMVYIKLYAFSGKTEGIVTNDLDSLAWTLRIPGEVLRAHIDTLITAGLLQDGPDGLTLTRYADEQARVERAEAAERKRRERERERRNSDANRGRHSDVTNGSRGCHSDVTNVSQGSHEKVTLKNQIKTRPEEEEEKTTRPDQNRPDQTGLEDATGGGGGGGDLELETVCRLAGIPIEKIPDGATVDDVLAALAAAYDDPDVQKPPLVVPHRIRAGVPVEYYDIAKWWSLLPEELLVGVGVKPNSGYTKSAPQPSAIPAEAQSAWTYAVGILRSEMNKADFLTWVQGAQPIDYRNGDTAEIIVATANDYARAWLEKRAQKILEQHASGALGRPVRIKFVIAR